MVVDDAGAIEAIVAAERNVAHRIIEEFMLLANETVAAHLEREDMPALYRVHETPDPQRVEEFEEFVSSLGFSLAAPAGAVHPRHFQHLVERIHGTPEERPIAFLMLRTMQKARYDAANLGHFGLAAHTYTHFTSPIRRYPDLVVHRVLRELRHGEASAERREELEDALPEVARHTSAMERRAQEAERELLQWKKVRFMADKVGDVFTGYVTGVAQFGLFVELVEHFVEGLVHVSTLADDFYRFDEQARVLFGERTKKIYRLGDAVRVQVVRVDLQPPADRARDRGGAGRGAEATSGPAARAAARAPPRRTRGGRAGRAAAPTRPGRRERATPQEGTVDAVRSIIVGTAGHIDHGKSTLVKALTGTDPDRLKEEKARGITIELGFAHAELPGGATVSFVDVPGHERFVRTMLAGVGGIDAVLLVVAADESVMPQTREHFDICRLLQVPRGAIALTKIDLADADMRELAALEVRELVAGSFLERRADRPGVGAIGRGARRAARRAGRSGRRGAGRATPAARCGCRWTARSRCAASARWSPARWCRARSAWTTSVAGAAGASGRQGPRAARARAGRAPRRWPASGSR